MSFTRFHDDPARIAKYAQQTSGPGKYILNTPGNGVKPCYMTDPNMRLQRWGGNLRTNTIGIENDLRGLTRPLNRDNLEINDYQRHSASSNSMEYPLCDATVHESRVSHPAWVLRNQESKRGMPYLHLDPQENVCYRFHNNTSTRILEKDGFLAKQQTFKYL